MYSSDSNANQLKFENPVNSNDYTDSNRNYKNPCNSLKYKMQMFNSNAKISKKTMEAMESLEFNRL